MPKYFGNLPLVQWPLFLLASKVIQLLYLFFLLVCDSFSKCASSTVI
jgi:hypothetical protein